MNRISISLLVMVFHAVSVSGAWAKYPTDVCPKSGKLREIISLKKFQTESGKLIQVVPPNLANIPARTGRAEFHVIVLPDGRAFVEGADGVTARFVFDVEDRLGAMRYMPPKFAGRLVCVGFDVEWKGDVPRAYKVRPQGMYR